MAENDIIAYKELASGGFLEVALAPADISAAAAIHASTHHTGGSDPLTPANIGAAPAVNVIELTPSPGSTTITTSQLPARGIAYAPPGETTYTVNLPTPDIRQSGLTLSIKTEYEEGSGTVFITVVHNATTLLNTELDEDESSIDFLWDGYAWTYSSTSRLRSYPNRVLQLPAASGTIARTEDFASPPAIGNTTPNSGAFTTLSASAASGAALTVTDTTTSSDLNYPLIVQRGTTRLFGVRDDGAAEANVFRIPNLPSANVTAQIDSAGLKLRDTNSIQFSSTANIFSPDTFLLRDGAAGTLAQRNAANPQTFRLYTTYASTTSFERLSLRGQTTNNFIIATEKGTTGGAARGLELQTDSVTRLTLGDAGGVTIADANDIAVGTTTGTKIGTATSQKLGFFNATPVVQQAAIADATDAATTQARLNDLLATMRTFGLIAT